MSISEQNNFIAHIKTDANTITALKDENSKKILHVVLLAAASDINSTQESFAQDVDKSITIFGNPNDTIEYNYNTDGKTVSSDLNEGTLQFLYKNVYIPIRKKNETKNQRKTNQTTWINLGSQNHKSISENILYVITPYNKLNEDQKTEVDNSEFLNKVLQKEIIDSSLANVATITNRPSTPPSDAASVSENDAETTDAAVNPSPATPAAVPAPSPQNSAETTDAATNSPPATPAAVPAPPPQTPAETTDAAVSPSAATPTGITDVAGTPLPTSNTTPTSPQKLKITKRNIEEQEKNFLKFVKLIQENTLESSFSFSDELMLKILVGATMSNIDLQNINRRNYKQNLLNALNNDYEYFTFKPVQTVDFVKNFEKTKDDKDIMEIKKQWIAYGGELQKRDTTEPDSIGDKDRYGVLWHRILSKTTKQFIQNTIHYIPTEFIQENATKITAVELQNNIENTTTNLKKNEKRSTQLKKKLKERNKLSADEKQKTYEDYVDSICFNLYATTLIQQLQKIQSAAERAAAEQAAAEKAEADRVAAEKAEVDRVAAEKAEADRAAAEKAESDRVAAEKAESDRLAAEKAEADRVAEKIKTVITDFENFTKKYDLFAEKAISENSNRKTLAEDLKRARNNAWNAINKVQELQTQAENETNQELQNKAKTLLPSALVEATEALNASKEKFDTLEPIIGSNLADFTTKIKKYESEIKTLKGKIEAFENSSPGEFEYKGQTINVSAYENTIQNHEKKVNELTETIDNQKTQIEDFTKNVAEFKANKLKLEEQLTNTNKEIQRLRATNETLQKTVDEAVSDEAVKTQIEEYKNEKKRLEKEIKKIESENTKEKTKNATLNDNVTRLQTEEATLKAKNTALTSENTGLKTETAKYKALPIVPDLSITKPKKEAKDILKVVFRNYLIPTSRISVYDESPTFEYFLKLQYKNNRIFSQPVFGPQNATRGEEIRFIEAWIEHPFEDSNAAKHFNTFATNYSDRDPFWMYKITSDRGFVDWQYNVFAKTLDELAALATP